MSDQRFRLEIHPDDRDQWRAMTGRDEDDDNMPPIKSREGLDYMLESARRNGVRVLRHWAVGDPTTNCRLFDGRTYGEVCG